MDNEVKFNFNDIRSKVFGNVSGGGLIDLSSEDLTLGGIIQELIPLVMRIGGLILFLYLLWGGIGYLVSFGNPEKMKTAWAKIWQALLGFVIIFTSWWLIKLIEVIFGINILGG